jgi:hypothetical protein
MGKNIPTFKQFKRMDEQYMERLDKRFFDKIIVASIKDGQLGGIDFETMDAFDHLDGVYQELIGYEADQIYVIDAASIKYGDDISINAEDLMKGTHHLKILKIYN